MLLVSPLYILTTLFELALFLFGFFFVLLYLLKTHVSVINIKLNTKFAGRITYELVKLIVHADGTQREISCAGSNNSATATALDRLVQQTTRIETKLDNMLQLMYVIEDAINKTSHGIETVRRK